MGEIHKLIAVHGRDGALALTSNDAAERRRVMMAAEIMALERPNKGYLHAGFCMVAMPHRKLSKDNEPYVLENGDFQLILTPKPLHVEAGEPVYAGLPYGPKARLILMYMATYAVKRKTKIVSLGDSMTSWINKLGFANASGGERGVISAVNEQAKRISRTEFTMIWADHQGSRLRDQPLVKGLETFGTAPAQLSLLSGPDTQAPTDNRRRRRYDWVKEIELSDEFFDHLMDHKVVLSEDAIAKLKGSSWALDIYLWLCYRLRSVQGSTRLISWAALRAQFAPHQYANNIHVFRDAVMIPALRDVLACYPEARVDWDERGVVLHESPPPVPYSTTHQVLLATGR